MKGQPGDFSYARVGENEKLLENVEQEYPYTVLDTAPWR